MYGLCGRDIMMSESSSFGKGKLSCYCYVYEVLRIGV